MNPDQNTAQPPQPPQTVQPSPTIVVPELNATPPVSVPSPVAPSRSSFTTPQTQSSNKSAVLPMVLIIFVGLMVAGGLGFYFMSIKNSSTPTTANAPVTYQQPTKAIVTTAPTPTLSSEEQDISSVDTGDPNTTDSQSLTREIQGL